MKIWKLISREIAYRKLGFMAGLLSLTVATAVLVALAMQLRAHDLTTEQTLLETERELRAEMTQLEDRYRRIMRDMGHNVLILNREQDMAEFRRLGHPNTYLEYEDAWRLAHGEVTTLNHLLPVLQERVLWQEKKIEVMLSGIRGQVPVFTKPEFLTEDDEYRSPIVPRIPDGMADLGADIAVRLELRPDDSIVLNGQSLTVNRVHAHRGSDDDITVTVPLHHAQDILGRPGKINGIFALECVCDLDELGRIHDEVAAILPHARVYEFTSLIAPRAEVRQQAEAAHRQVVDAAMRQRDRMREGKERLAAVIVPLLALGAGLWIFLLVFNSVRERRYEIGVLRAVGFSRVKILWIFLAKAWSMGVLGGMLGVLVGLSVGLAWHGGDSAGWRLPELIDPAILLLGLLLAPVLATMAALLPAVMAARLDPALILREE